MVTESTPPFFDDNDTFCDDINTAKTENQTDSPDGNKISLRERRNRCHPYRMRLNANQHKDNGNGRENISTQKKYYNHKLNKKVLQQTTESRPTSQHYLFNKKTPGGRNHYQYNGQNRYNNNRRDDRLFVGGSAHYRKPQMNKNTAEEKYSNGYSSNYYLREKRKKHTNSPINGDQREYATPSLIEEMKQYNYTCNEHDNFSEKHQNQVNNTTKILYKRQKIQINERKDVSADSGHSNALSFESLTENDEEI
ncbi:MAG: hypothetical protein OXC48_10690 [Endozoicomonadaceae bacterium]|nr:hypothetical protein [Endozoicomonadaceae bacterium]